MTDSNPERAIDQVTRIEKVCEFFENPLIKQAVERAPPMSMPPDAGSSGFDIPLWVGLGTVGLWAALDAFAERAGLLSKCSTCSRKCIVAAYISKFQGSEEQIFSELDDLRHLYAHNYAGEADDKYFQRHQRHVLERGICVELSCGAIFDGWRLRQKDKISRSDLTRSDRTMNLARMTEYALNLSDLRTYSRAVLSVLERFQITGLRPR